MESRGIIWAGVVFTLVILAYLVPYVFLSGTDAWYGAFLFWVIFGALAIAVIAIITSSWRD
jgi:hypothetical protein